MDSLNYLGYCAPHYGARALIEHAGAVWAALKAELLPLSVPASAAAATSAEPKDAEILEQATSCLTSWVETFQEEEKDFFSHDASSTTTAEVRKRRSTTAESGIFLQLILKDESVEDLIASLEDDDTTTHRWRTDEISAAAAGPGPGSSSSRSSSTISNNRAKLRVQATARVLSAAACASPYSCYAICSQVLTRIMGIIRGMQSESPDTGLEAQSSSLLGTEQQQNVISEDGMLSCGSSNSHFLSSQQNTVCFRASKSSSSRNCDYWVAIGLEVVLQIVSAAGSMAKKLCAQAATTMGRYPLSVSGSESTRRWLDPLQILAQDLIAAFCQAIAINDTNEASILGGKQFCL